jgi:hypothetical protein
MCSPKRRRLKLLVTLIGNRAFVEDEASGIMAIVDETGRASVWGRPHAEAIELEREDLELLAGGDLLAAAVRAGLRLR